ncbi:MAG: Jag N-terminal domain-containing protein [Desulfobacterales bacterium]|nr:Jag N-terminal domain-containing protein [Desulfobacterales bacterium]
MPYIEFHGKNVENAVENASNTLKLRREELKYDVISSGSSGIFGLVGVKKARIRVFVPDSLYKKEIDHVKQMNADEFKSISTDIQAKKEVLSLVDEAFGDSIIKHSEPEVELDIETEVEIEEESSEETDVETDVETDDQDRAIEETSKDVSDDEFVQDDDLSDEDQVETVIKSDSQENNLTKASDRPIKVISEECIQIGKDALEFMIHYLVEQIEITTETNSERILYRISTANPSALIGNRGQTLDAIQYLLDKIVNKKSDRRVRILVDVEGYLEARKSSLVALANRLAERVKKTGKPSSIGQMTAQDRRIVHITLKDDKGVRTQSMGDGYYRKLVIFPKKYTPKRKKPSLTSKP